MDDARFAAGLDRIILLTVLLNDDMNRGLAADGLTPSRTSLLWTLRRLGPSAQKDLAAAMKIAPRTVTGLVDGLVATGFVSREAYPDDRRAFLVTFTAKGLTAIEKLEADQREFGRQLFAAMPSERFDGLMAGLDDVLATLHALGLRSPF
ncbi:MarR family winged helix-turn-helix transcriptional regulator [Paractinoplanes globisporus]|jgi:DNA-binding MarR family transcriptional regulator|uniref:MarR family winged helix-turn-helix transcriptional regulator n=1 Tax=Paractinoplanes globisporus TaxID=113565 RepID=A0ABW6WWX7_9ACTN|nr:MarR family transcriptional regulator [Actinoplanes globisporus]